MVFGFSPDFQQNQAVSFVVEVFTGSFPAGAVAGRMVYRADLGALFTYNGTTWIHADPAQFANASIALSKLAQDPLDRSLHTGSQLAATISNFDTQVRTSRLDQMAAPTAQVSANNQKVVNLGAGTADSDAINLGQAKALLYGTLYKRIARASTTGNITIANPGTATFDGVALTPGQPLAVTFQTTASQNGLYVFNGSASPLTRALDTDGNTEIQPGLEIFISEGALYGDHTFKLITAGAITVGSTSLNFVDQGVSSVYAAGNGLNLVGQTFTVNPEAGGGILVTASGVRVDPGLVVKKFEQTVGDGTATSFTVTHNLNNAYPDITCWETGGAKRKLEPRIESVNANSVTVRFGVAPAAGAIRVIVQS